jgi:predicted DNA-binding protein (UPF0251 family)
MSDTTSKYRTALLNQFHSSVKITMDEIEDEVCRLLDYTKTIDLDSKENMQEGIGTIVNALKELAQKVY